MSASRFQANAGDAMTLPRAAEGDSGLDHEPALYEDFVIRFAKCDRKVFGYIMAFLHNHNDAEDVFQETSLALWRDFHQFRQDAEFLPWALGVCRNQIRKFRRNKQKDRLFLNDSLIDELAKSAALRLGGRQDALSTCLERESEQSRELLDQFYGARMSAAEIAQMGDCTVHAIYKRLKMVRKRLRECINQRLAVEGGRK